MELMAFTVFENYHYNWNPDPLRPQIWFSMFINKCIELPCECKGIAHIIFNYNELLLSLQAGFSHKMGRSEPALVLYTAVESRNSEGGLPIHPLSTGTSHDESKCSTFVKSMF